MTLKPPVLSLREDPTDQFNRYQVWSADGAEYLAGFELWETRAAYLNRLNATIVEITP